MDRTRVRKGTKSCAECRRRKLRCTWPQTAAAAQITPSQQTCTPCALHHRICRPQVGRLRAARTNGLSAQDRISYLEHEVTRLTDAADNKQFPSCRKPDLFNQDGTSSIMQAETSSPDVSDVEDAQSPTHLRHLFDNFAIQASYNVETVSEPDQRQQQRMTKLHDSALQKARTRLSRLLPSKEDVNRIASYATRWTAMYHALFPAVSSMNTSGKDSFVAQYDDMCDPLVRPTALAAFLLTLAITMQQIAVEDLSFTTVSDRDVQGLIDDISRTVEKDIVAKNALAGTVEGLETTLLYVRLQLGRGNLKNMWLTLRRTIALAELIGLPRVAYELERSRVASLSPEAQVNKHVETQSIRVQAELWDAICATDRNASMMFNLPAATASYDFPLTRPLVENGRVSAQAYNYQLSNICLKVHELDEMIARHMPELETYEKVLSADRHLRALASRMQKGWWEIDPNRGLADQLVQFWHKYILARIHLYCGLTKNVEEQYFYSRSSCLEACQQVVQRYIVFRHQLASGFFVCRVVDIQAFTAAVFLLLFSGIMRVQDNEQPTLEPLCPQYALDLVEQLIQVQKSISNKPGSDSAREAIEVLESLKALFNDNDSTAQASVVLRVPLLGKVRISPTRKSSMWERSRATNTEQREHLLRNNLEVRQNSDHIVGNGSSDNQLQAPSTAEIAMQMPWLLEIDTTAAWLSETLTSDDLAEWGLG